MLTVSRGVLLACVIVLGSVMPAQAALVGLPQATFGGSGIPNTAVAVWNGSGITLGLTAHTRCGGTPYVCGEPVANDGVSTFSTDPGAPFSNPDYAGWNFGFYADNDSLTQYSVQLFYSGPGFTNATFGPFGLPQGATLQDSWNLGMSHLAGASFNPLASGLYTITLNVYGAQSSLVAPALLGSTSIDVQVGDPVPEPASLTLLGLGLASLGARRWRQRKP